MSAFDPSVTKLLVEWRQGDASAIDRLTPLVYAELRSLAGGLLRRERAGHTLQPTELVHEAYLKLVHEDERGFSSRAHFLAVAARHMRQILVDHARRRGRLKRGGGVRPVTCDLTAIASAEAPVDLLILDEALSAMSVVDERKSRILEMYYFGGMSQEEIAEVVGVHENTVARDLRLACAWLQVRLQPKG
jgi:RNA polymerase sigma factor (TIGR02999 family)